MKKNGEKKSDDTTDDMGITQTESYGRESGQSTYSNKRGSSGSVQLFMFFWRRLSGFGACGADGKGEPKRFSRGDAESTEGRAAHRDSSPYPRGSFRRFGSGRIGGDTSPYLGAGISDVGETKEEGREQGCSRYYGESCCG